MQRNQAIKLCSVRMLIHKIIVQFHIGQEIVLFFKLEYF